MNNILYVTVVTIVIVIILFSLYRNKENFINNYIEKFDKKYNDKYEKYKDNISNKKQIYLNFLGNLYDNYKIKKSKVPVEDICNPAIQELLENEALKDTYSKYSTNTENTKTENIIVPNVHKDKCISIANYLCDTTDPSLYMSENPYFPPRWLVNTYKNTPAPNMTNLNCFKTNYMCCKKSM